MNKKVFIIVIIFIIIVIIMAAKMGKKKEAQEENKTNYAETRFDMNNIENAKVEGDVKKNTSEKVEENKEYSNLTVSNIKIESNVQTGITEFSATVTNNGKKKFESKNVKVVFLDKDGAEIGRMVTLIEDIEAGESTEVASFSAFDIANCYDIKIEEME